VRRLRDQSVGHLKTKAILPLPNILSRSRKALLQSSTSQPLPKASRSDRIRGAPQRKFSRAIRTIKRRTSLETFGRPPRQRPCARYRQSADQPSRRQRKTVSGWAMIRLSRHWDHQRENKIQNSRSQRRKQGHEFHCAGARRFDGAGRSIPTAARCGFAVRCARAAALRLSASPSRQPTARRSNPPTNSRGLSFEKDR